MTRRINMARWQPHVEEARRRGISLKAYAAEQGLSLYSVPGLTGAASRRACGSTGSSGGKFAAVRVVAAPAVAMLRVAAQLPNGVSLHVDARGSEVAAVIAALGALPCSA